MNKHVILGGRILLGAIMLFFGLNFFLKLMSMPPIPGDGGTFMTILYSSGFLLVVKLLEILVGIALLSNRFVPLALLIAAPLSVNFVLFHALFAPAGGMLAYLTLVLNVLLFFGYKKAYAPLLKARM